MGTVDFAIQSTLFVFTTDPDTSTISAETRKERSMLSLFSVTTASRSFTTQKVLDTGERAG